MHVEQIDHIVLTVKNVDASAEFYSGVLGMTKVVFGEGRIALKFGNQKINLHPYGYEFEPKAYCPQPGSADLCFVTTVALKDVIQHLDLCGVSLVEGPIKRTGAIGSIQSVYFRDPDQNLLEVSSYEHSD